jgi:hypothetical protein
MGYIAFTHGTKIRPLFSRTESPPLSPLAWLMYAVVYPLRGTEKETRNEERGTTSEATGTITIPLAHNRLLVSPASLALPSGYDSLCCAYIRLRPTLCDVCKAEGLCVTLAVSFEAITPGFPSLYSEIAGYESLK